MSFLYIDSIQSLPRRLENAPWRTWRKDNNRAWGHAYRHAPNAGEARVIRRITGESGLRSCRSHRQSVMRRLN